MKALATAHAQHIYLTNFKYSKIDAAELSRAR